MCDDFSGIARLGRGRFVYYASWVDPHSGLTSLSVYIEFRFSTLDDRSFLAII